MKNKILILFFFLFIACSEDQDLTVNSYDIPDQSFFYHWTSGIKYFMYGNEIAHDDQILESENFLVFSDASGYFTKISMIETAENGFKELLDSLGYENGKDLGIINRSDKIWIYIKKNIDILQQAYPEGFLLFATDSPMFNPLSNEVFERNNFMVKHETVHVLNFRMGLTWANWMPFWFSEGIAEYLSGGAFKPLSSQFEVRDWFASDLLVNPISINFYEDISRPDITTRNYYRMFGFTIKYLLHKDGLGKNTKDIRKLIEDLGRSRSFDKSFSKIM